MEFINDSENIMRLLMERFSHFYKKKTSSEKKVYDDVLKNIHDNLISAEIQMENIWNSSLLYKNVREVLNVNELTIEGGHFFPEQIRENVKTNLLGEVSYRCNILGRSVLFSFYFMEDNMFNEIHKIDGLVKKMIMWLIFITPFVSSKCSKTLNVLCYLTSFKKGFPSSNITVLNSNNANTAFTYRCPGDGQIIIFRKEEIFKVFIHESFHTLGLDWYNNDIIKTKVKGLFPISSDMNINESYCEYWACFMNSIFTAYSLPGGEKLDGFLIYSEYCLSFERIFSLIQMVKILHFMGLTYPDLYEKNSISKQKRDLLYKEDTNIFAYYILKCILLFNIYDFLKWCKTNNTNMFSFDETSHNYNKLYEFINSKYKNKHFLKSIKNATILLDRLQKEQLDTENDFIFNTMRMSIIEMG